MTTVTPAGAEGEQGSQKVFGPALATPRRRRLRTYAFDPMSTRLSGRFLTVDVPYESNLREGPCGDLLEVVDYDPIRDKWYAPVNLNERFILAQDGLKPREGDPRSHQQVVYAVAMSVIERFEKHLGRRFRWQGGDKLAMVPHAFEGRNAFFDPTRGAVLFGYYRAELNEPGANLPGQVIFTCLSSDIIAHELTHAIVHHLRPHFAEATNQDVFAWHEAFADLIALFHHFAYREVVFDAVTATSSRIDEAGSALFDLASEFGQSTGRGTALRSAIAKQERTPEQFMAATEPHERGACFVAAVFDAYLDHFHVAIADLLRIATAGTGVLPEGRLHPDLVARIAREAVLLAERFLAMVVRAFDYLPPVDVTFSDVIRAIVTSDRALYPDDARGLRAGLIEALRRRGIIPEKVDSLTDDALKWPPPGKPLSLRGSDPDPDVPLQDLIHEATMNLDPGGKPGKRSGRVGKSLEDWAAWHAVAIGLHPDRELPIELINVHITYREADDGQPRPEVVVQFMQHRTDLERDYQPDLPAEERTRLRAGTTLIARVNGEVDYIVSKPLPLSLSEQDTGDPDFDYVNKFGHDRLKKMKAWFDRLDDEDELSMWIAEPAVNRLNFAGLHYEGML